VPVTLPDTNGEPRLPEWSMPATMSKSATSGVAGGSDRFLILPARPISVSPLPGTVTICEQTANISRKPAPLLPQVAEATPTPTEATPLGPASEIVPLRFKPLIGDEVGGPVNVTPIDPPPKTGVAGALAANGS